jgi:hypothetical protein
MAEVLIHGSLSRNTSKSMIVERRRTKLAKERNSITTLAGNTLA